MVILILSVLFFAYLTAEAVKARQDRKKLQHVIYVNGTRGKSTVSRLIAAGLAAGGYRVMCKTTGTLPLCLHPDGREEEIRRRGPANIREQLKYLHAAAEEKADILVIECMALQPEYQRVSARNMLRNDIGVITNARLDHMDAGGDPGLPHGNAAGRRQHLYGGAGLPGAHERTREGAWEQHLLHVAGGP